MQTNGKARCGAKLRNGKGTCQHEAGWGTPHVGFGACKLHGGNTKHHVKKWESHVAEQAARDAVKALDLTTLPNVHPALALSDAVNRSAAMVHFISQQIEGLERDEVSGLMVTKVTDANGVERTVGANHWVKLLGEWDDRLTRTSKAVMDAGIEERQTRIMEQQASVFAGALYGVLKELGIDTGAEETLNVIRRHMMAIDSEVIEVA